MIKLKYIKEDGEREESSPSTQISSDSIYSNDLPSNYKLKSVGVDYSKTDGVLSQSLFVIVSGGTSRERSFFQELDEKDSFKSLKFIFLSSKQGDGGLTPKMMQNFWSDCVNKGLVEKNDLKFHIESIDKVYMVTDVDHYEKELRDILKKQKEGDPRWIISNPDIEIWIYYCFRNTPKEDLHPVIIAAQSKRSSLMKTINGTFNNGGGLDPRKAFTNIKIGIKNARYFYKEDSWHFPDLLSTQMFFLSEDICDVLGQEFTNWNEERIKKINKYRAHFISK